MNEHQVNSEKEKKQKPNNEAPFISIFEEPVEDASDQSFASNFPDLNKPNKTLEEKLAEIEIDEEPLSSKKKPSIFDNDNDDDDDGDDLFRDNKNTATSENEHWFELFEDQKLNNNKDSSENKSKKPDENKSDNTELKEATASPHDEKNKAQSPPKSKLDDLFGDDSEDFFASPSAKQSSSSSSENGPKSSENKLNVLGDSIHSKKSQKKDENDLFKDEDDLSALTVASKPENSSQTEVVELINNADSGLEIEIPNPHLSSIEMIDEEENQPDPKPTLNTSNNNNTFDIELGGSYIEPILNDTNSIDDSFEIESPKPTGDINTTTTNSNSNVSTNENLDDLIFEFLDDSSNNQNNTAGNIEMKTLSSKRSPGPSNNNENNNHNKASSSSTRENIMNRPPQTQTSSSATPTPPQATTVYGSSQNRSGPPVTSYGNRMASRESKQTAPSKWDIASDLTLQNHGGKALRYFATGAITFDSCVIFGLGPMGLVVGAMTIALNFAMYSVARLLGASEDTARAIGNWTQIITACAAVPAILFFPQIAAAFASIPSVLAPLGTAGGWAALGSTTGSGLMSAFHFLGFLMAAHPIGLAIIAGIGLLALLWDPVIKPLGEAIIKGFKAVGEFLSWLLSPIIDCAKFIAAWVTPAFDSPKQQGSANLQNNNSTNESQNPQREARLATPGGDRPSNGNSTSDSRASNIELTSTSAWRTNARGDHTLNESRANAEKQKSSGSFADIQLGSAVGSFLSSVLT